jgi:chromosome partitioning protein
MARKIGVVSQKGGTGKSTVTRLLAVEYSKADWEVLIADMDLGQRTSTNWAAERMQQGLEPEISSVPSKSVSKVPAASDLVIFDGRPFADKQTEEIAKASDLVLLPTNVSSDDLDPTILLAKSLVKHGVAKSRIRVVLSRVGSEAEARDARELIEDNDFKVLENYVEEKPSFRTAMNGGRCISETSYPTLTAASVALAEEIGTVLEEIA